MLGKVSFATLARETEIGESALRRHCNNHLLVGHLRQIRENEAASPADLIERLIEALVDVSAVRSAALLSGNSALVLRAAAATGQLSGQLMAAVGTDAATVVEDLRQGELFADVLATGIATDYRFASVAIALLRQRERHDIADDALTIAAPDPATPNLA